jgi:hypothetical protein
LVLAHDLHRFAKLIERRIMIFESSWNFHHGRY